MLKEMVQAQTCVVNRDLPVIELNGERLLTTELLAETYGTTPDNIKVNFNNHKDNFQEDKHYFFLEGDDLREFKSQVNNIYPPIVSKFTSNLYLWTERGANRHCKILDTDKAWEQFDNLEETYFRVKEQKPTCIEDVLIQSLQEMKDLKQQINQANTHALEAKATATKTDSRVDHLEDTMVVDYSEQEFLNKHARARVLMAVGGKESNAYKKLSKVIFKELWGDYKTYFQINSYKNTPKAKYLEAIEYIANWEPSNNNKLEILRLNSL